MVRAIAFEMRVLLLTAIVPQCLAAACVEDPGAGDFSSMATMQSHGWTWSHDGTPGGCNDDHEYCGLDGCPIPWCVRPSTDAFCAACSGDPSLTMGYTFHGHGMFTMEFSNGFDHLQSIVVVFLNGAEIGRTTFNVPQTLNIEFHDGDVLTLMDDPFDQDVPGYAFIVIVSFSYTCLEPSCSPDDFTGPSSSTGYPCQCGSAVCAEGEWCHAVSSTCQEPCPAGSERNVPGDPCTPCAPGHYSREGEACKQVVEHAVGQLTVPSLALAWDDQSTVTLTLTLDALPTDIYETDPLSYILDIQSTVNGLEFNNACNQHWAEPRSPTTSVSLSYDALSQDCLLALGLSTELRTIVRTGFIGVFVIIGSGADARKVRLWTIALELKFDAEAADMFSPVGTVIDDPLTGQSFTLSGFASTLGLMDTGFNAPRGNSNYELGEIVNVQQELVDESQRLDLRIIKVWLSSSEHAEDASATVRELTETIVLQASDGPSVVQFSFAAGGCESCYLHVLSEVVHLPARRLGGRRLPAGGDYLANSVYVAMLPAPPANEPEVALEPAGPQIHLEMVVQGMDYHALTARPSLEERFVGILQRSVVERIGYGISRANVSVTLSPGSVNVRLQVRMPVEVGASAVKQAVADEAFGHALEASVSEGVGNMEDLHLVMSGPLVARLTAVEFAEAARKEPHRDEEGGLAPAAVASIVVSVSLVLLLGALGMLYAWCLRRRAQQRQLKEAAYGDKAPTQPGLDQASVMAVVRAI